MPHVVEVLTAKVSRSSYNSKGASVSWHFDLVIVIPSILRCLVRSVGSAVAARVIKIRRKATSAGHIPLAAPYTAAEAA